MSERLMVCKALAAMLGNKGELTEDEVKFVAHAAFELALTQEDNEAVQRVLGEGGDYGAFIKEVTSRPMRTFLFRRVVAAILLDDRIDDSERKVISDTAAAFGYDSEVVEDFIGWMNDGIAWERRGAEIMSRL